MSDSQLPKKIVFICFNECPLKMKKNAYYFMLKAFFVKYFSLILLLMNPGKYDLVLLIGLCEILG